MLTVVIEMTANESKDVRSTSSASCSLIGIRIRIYLLKILRIDLDVTLLLLIIVVKLFVTINSPDERESPVASMSEKEPSINTLHHICKEL